MKMNSENDFPDNNARLLHHQIAPQESRSKRNTGTNQPSKLTRRSTLTTVAASLATGLSLAGCLSRDAEKYPPIDAEESDFREIADIAVPEVATDIPTGVTDEYITDVRHRVESLLEPIPHGLTAEIPNEAVRNYINEEREKARKRLDRADAMETNFDSVTPLRGARRYAGTAEGAYAAAMGERDRETVKASYKSILDDVDARRSKVTRTGEQPRQTVVVWTAIERHLERLSSADERLEHLSPQTSKVKAVGQVSGWLESARTRLETVTHIQNQQAAVGDTSFDDLFEQVGTDLLDDVADWTDPLPSGRAAPEELFDAQVEGTPRYEIGVNLIRTITARTNSARRRFDNGWLALTLMDLYGLENERRTLETIEERVENGELGRPESDEEILEAKQAALREIESILDNPGYPYLVTRQVARVLQTIRSADWRLENYHSDEGAVQSLGEFELAAERARKIPATTSWFVETLDQT